MAIKPPNMMAQLNGQMGMARQGGIPSAASTPKVMMGSTGQNFATMENSLLTGMAPNPKQLAAGKPGRQYFTQAGGGDYKGMPKSPKVGVKPPKFPTMKVK